MTTPSSEPHGTWVVRRRFMMAIVAFCMVTIAWTIQTGRTDRVAETVITMSFGVLWATLGSYVFGAVWAKVK